MSNVNNIGEDISPNAVNVLESNRSLGYSVEEAIADLIDNSIGASAKNISFHLIWNNGIPKFVLLDDGHGMSIETSEFINSFKLGAKSPLNEREFPDLGRFGFGMKTASLSQSRELIVISKRTESEIGYRSLDLDFISKNNLSWKLKIIDKESSLGFYEKILEKGNGTAIIWNNWDRAPKNEDEFNSLIETISNYLSVIFHKFIENGLNIYANTIKLKPCSPIPIDDGAELYSKIELKENKSIVQTSFLLQHPSKWKEDYESMLAFNSFRLFEGFERQQGIYIYRCNRLLNPKGGWLGVLKRGNSAKLARVIIDYPNNADSMWSLDITKTNATIPYEFKKEIQSFVSKTSNASNEKINRGIRILRKSLNTYKNSLVWEEIKDSQIKSIRYKVNYDHEIFRNLIESRKIPKDTLITILNLVSETLPVYRIISNNDLDPSLHDRAQSKSELTSAELEIAKLLYKSYLNNSTKFQAISTLLSIEPFCFFENQIKSYLDAL
jgi:hypothetical protein